MTELDQRRKFTAERLESLRSELPDANSLVKGKACVYATGSYGRMEASSYSDLDLFILGMVDRVDKRYVRRLAKLDEICIKADLIRTIRRFKIKDFDSDGQYLSHYTVREFVEALGTPRDDESNTFTGRLLLLLESQCLLGSEIYAEALGEVLSPYWRDYDDHSENFMPAYLTNDILRLWRTFCVNYEARTSRQPADVKRKGKVKNYKLKYSRLLTCFSAIIYLLNVYCRKGTVAIEDAKDMISQPPLDRLLYVKSAMNKGSIESLVDRIFEQYETFLAFTNQEELSIIGAFGQKEIYNEKIKEAHDFGDTMFKLLTAVGGDSKMLRLLVI